MEEMAISKFKPKCLAELEKVGVAGEPMAEVAPAAEPNRRKRVLGGMPGRIVGDLKESLFTPEDTDRWGEDRQR